MRVVALALMSLSSVALAQNGGAGAVASITERDIRERIGIIADDSMGGRDTPSRGLDLTARYVAGEFARFGLVPAGDSGRFEQRYPIRRSRLDGELSRVIVTSGTVSAVASARRDLIYVFGPRTGRPIVAPVLLVGGRLDLDSAKSIPVERKIVLVVANARARNAIPVNQFLAPIFDRSPAAVVILLNNDTTTLARQVANQFRERPAVEGESANDPVVTMAHERGLGSALRAGGVDVAQLRQSATFVSRELPSLQVSVTVANEGNGALSAPNVAGILEGSDPVLKHEYVLFSAHMDHVGIRPGVRGDSIWNGADDDASGTAGVIELAEAFSKGEPRPRRSMIFLTVSGEEKGLWGSEYFAAHSPVPLDQVVANLNMDMIGRNWRDTIAVIGKEHSDLGATLARVNGEHPELGMNAIDDIWPNESFYFRSDHYNFARRGVPVLFFFNGTHKDYHEASDTPDKIDAEKESRIVRLVYYLGEAIANADARPQWNEASRKRIVGK